MTKSTLARHCGRIGIHFDGSVSLSSRTYIFRSKVNTISCS